MKKLLHLRISGIILLVLLSSCSQLEKAEKLISGLSEKERYQKENDIPDEIFQLWENRTEQALNDSLEIEIPYTETGSFKPRNFAIYSYQAVMMPGEVLNVETKTDSTSTLVFSELYRKVNPGGKFEKIASGKASMKSLNFEIQESGIYKIVIQPEIEANSPFRIQVEKSPAYLFPVMDGENQDIGSYWGDIRDGGKRNHEGIDIFASRGTPVLAATQGRIGFSGEKGLGGKQVWLRDQQRNQSLYYAHLDSIVPGLSRVQQGDTLGFVGNTGNARTTPPHLHFGIYKSGRGALNPLGFVYRTENPEPNLDFQQDIATRLKISSSLANLRDRPAAYNSQVLKKGKLGDTLFVQGKAEDWFHVRDIQDRSMYIHESLVEPAF
ncbi:M23 family metallopeptidase [Gramella sp. GC03-9]|uniref:M23 family metallopeptidase n=1 Tax=Christiangramia oceanisediminis TaxID=2920386 RepID=A0A9X2KXB2_9FLAO|nr:peptidoglycan DD-metalloendopeptidase family protein [Gramella oceanisediminis]MCP9198961.1 M23 family metallopeptidase [Gramella oceanisediminis]